METHKAFATCASQYSWNKVIENLSNAKKIWSRHGIQAWTSVSCFDHSCTELLGNLGSPLSLKRTWIYALVITNRRTAGTLTFVKTIRLSCFTLYCHICLCLCIVHQMPHIFPTLRGQCKKFKTWYICPAIPQPCQGIGCVIKTHWYIILIGRELTCSRKLMLEI